jgi:hypothetical protein
MNSSRAFVPTAGAVKAVYDFHAEFELYVRGLRPAALSLEPVDVGVRPERQQARSSATSVRRNRHELAEHLIGRLGDADVISERLGHLVDAVEPLEQGIVITTCGSWP